MSDISRDYRKATGQRDSPNAEVGIAQRCSTVLQLCSHLAIATGGSPVERKGRQVWRKRLVQPFQEEACTSSQSVSPVYQLPQGDTSS